jgi:hypothetical protein
VAHRHDRQHVPLHVSESVLIRLNSFHLKINFALVRPQNEEVRTDLACCPALILQAVHLSGVSLPIGDSLWGRPIHLSDDGGDLRLGGRLQLSSHQIIHLSLSIELSRHQQRQDSVRQLRIESDTPPSGLVPREVDSVQMEEAAVRK